MDSEKQSPAGAGVKREADVYDLLAWLEVNKKTVSIVVVALIAMGFLLAAMRHFSRQKEENASGRLLALKPTLVTPTNAPPPQASGFLKVAQDFKGTSAAERARLLAASTLFTEGKYAEAEREFAAFVKDHSNSPWTPSAALGVAASQEAGGKINEALASYQNVITAHGNSAVMRDAKLALARLNEGRNQPDQALRLYNELTTPPPGAPFGQGGDEEAARRKEALLRRHPNLDTSRAAPAPVSIQAVPAVPAPATEQRAEPATPAVQPVENP